MSNKINKYLYGWKLWVNYGNGWEYEIFEDTHKGYKENKKAYRENCTYPQKWTKGREINDAYIMSKVHTLPVTDCSINNRFIDAKDRKKVLQEYCKKQCNYKCLYGKDYRKTGGKNE